LSGESVTKGQYHSILSNQCLPFICR